MGGQASSVKLTAQLRTKSWQQAAQSRQGETLPNLQELWKRCFLSLLHTKSRRVLFLHPPLQGPRAQHSDWTDCLLLSRCSPTPGQGHRKMFRVAGTLAVPAHSWKLVMRLRLIKTHPACTLWELKWGHKMPEKFYSEWGGYTEPRLETRSHNHSGTTTSKKSGKALLCCAPWRGRSRMEAVKRQRYISEAAWLSPPYAKFAISFFSPFHHSPPSDKLLKSTDHLLWSKFMSPLIRTDHFPFLV